MRVPLFKDPYFFSIENMPHFFSSNFKAYPYPKILISLANWTIYGSIMI
jgi:hypothetical protein